MAADYIILPLFPLSTVVFPGEIIHLHIFETRYKQLINEVHSTGLTFGIFPYFEGKDNRMATEVELVEISKTYEDGKMDVRLRGTNLLRVVDFFATKPGRLYPGGEVERIGFFDNFDLDLNISIIAQLEKMYEVMNIDNITLKSPMEFRTSQIAHKVGFSNDQELQFLLFTNEKLRAEYMLKHLEVFVPQVILMENLRKRAELNGHFQNLNPPNI